MENMVIDKVWIKKNGKIGSRDHIMRAWFAFHVMLTITGGRAQCPNCAVPYGTCQFDVDRTITADRERDADGNVFDYYRAGFIVMLCAGCNAKRSRIQGAGMDIVELDRYIETVKNASMGIELPKESVCRDWWEARENYTDNRPAGEFF